MAQRLSPESLAMLRYLADGGWHDYETFILELGLLIPPGKALRKSEERLVNQLKVLGARKSPVPPDDVKIEQGRRALMLSAVNSMKKRYIEFETNEEGMRCRVRRRTETLPRRDQDLFLPPEEPSLHGGAVPYPCQVCGLIVGDRQLHEDWHVSYATLPVHKSKGVQPGALTAQEGIATVRAGSAVLGEAQIRQVVRQELNEHQKRLQQFLIGRFAALEGEFGMRIPKPHQRHPD